MEYLKTERITMTKSEWYIVFDKQLNDTVSTGILKPWQEVLFTALVETHDEIWDLYHAHKKTKLLTQ